MTPPGQSGVARKVVHMALGTCALLLRVLSPTQAALLAGAAVAFNWFGLHPLTGHRLLRDGERPRSLASGIVLYPLAVLGLILAFPRRPEIAAAAWGLLAFGDGMATLVGRRVASGPLPWNPSKTWSGLAGFIAAGWPAATGLAAWTRPELLDSPGRLAVWCLGATVLAGIAETLRSGVDDNLVVPWVGAAALYVATCVDFGLLSAASGSIVSGALVGLAVNVGCAGLAWAVRGVDRSGAVVGVGLGTALFAFGGSAGFGLLLVFFVLSTAATRAGWARKAALGIAQAKKGRRGARHALANVSAGVLFAFLARATPYPSLFALALVAAFATAAADTVASEWGQAFGRRHYLVTTLRRVPAGTDGAVSLEGTVAGWVAAVVVAGFGVVTGLVSPTAAAVAVGGAMAGSLLESFLGALAGPQGDLDNEIANLVNTLAGGLVAMAVAVATGM